MAVILDESGASLLDESGALIYDEAGAPPAAATGKQSGLGDDLYVAGYHPHYVRSCANFNPTGSASVTVPASGTATTPLHVDSMFYITAASGGNVSIVRNSAGQGGGSSSSFTIPTGAMLAVFVPAATDITPTYGAGNAPTWVVDGI